MTWFITFDFISLATLDMYILFVFCFTWRVKAPALGSARGVILLSVTMLCRVVSGSKALEFASHTFSTAPYRNLCDKVSNYCPLQSMVGRLFEGVLM